MIKNQGYIILFVVFLPISPLWSQDQGSVEPDSVVSVQPPDQIQGDIQSIETSPFDENKETPQAKAALYSAVLPGLGQAYNKKYWKIPLIYGGAAAMGYYISFSHDRYTTFRTLLFAESDQDPNTINDTELSEETLRRNTDDWRRNRDLMIGLLVLLYFLNIADAHVDAHLKEFDINEDLVLQLKPAFTEIETPVNRTQMIGLSLNLKFGK